MDVEAQIATPRARVELVHYRFFTEPDSKLRVDGEFRVELCLTSRHKSSRANYPDSWKQNRFERIGNLFVVPPSTDMLTKSDEAFPLTSVVCYLELQSVLELFDAIPASSDQLLLASLDIHDPRIRAALLRLAEELKHPGFASETFVDLAAGLLAVELMRHTHAVSAPQKSGGLAPWQLRRIDDRLSEIGEAPTLPVLAELCKVSVRQLTRGFRANRGCSIGAYVADCQLEHAKRLLTTDESVSAIGKLLGFSSSSNFCAAFRRATGLTPGDFRQRLLRTH